MLRSFRWGRCMHSVDFAVYFRVLLKSVPRIKALSGQINTPVIKNGTNG